MECLWVLNFIMLVEHIVVWTFVFMSNVIEISQPVSKLFTVGRHANTNVSGDISLIFLKKK